ncbi:hypothetical protein COU78_03520 [Candidatus Peregrinibacteria bacterium CG10_big_fil_rev_8_21_14_0_10_49_24]|nr:MAG: hypothetical protein COV83_05340 [Candidatus Peregrinibacteria bacterium CG11_big_fil_rev_8_21_14_0_20_49_14]PIR51189.1 MAG: hypothetical protein COU78_03520 [Candidatus Peregrinibacteria bacterium CG10_big_fil_rev_8_21_14_0_10_49_24]PJA67228.1 MAG: hypothetical protein CO157_05675 [Candidatus Peregrinibacteria bacterium CG_4_9_14_3_um_filter_49_12]
MSPRTPEGERLIDIFSTHWIKYVVPVVLYVLLTGTSILLFSIAGMSAHTAEGFSHVAFFIALILILIVHHWFFHSIMSEGMVDIFITNKRIISMRDRLFFCEDMHEVNIERIRAVEAQEHGILQNIFRYGNLWFDTGGSGMDKSATIELVPHPHRRAKTIMSMLEMK